MQNITPREEILIVDDQPANLEVLTNILEQSHYEIRVTVNGALAVSAVRSLPPDMILLDIMMPGMSGFEVCEILKSDPATAHIPIIFISALDATEDKVRAFTAGGVDYIIKPFQYEEVLARVETHLSLRRLQKMLEGRNIELQRLAEDNARLYVETQGWAETLEKQVADRTEALENALQRERSTRDQLILAGKLAGLGRMVASIAHELNNPLQTVSNALYLIKSKIPDDPRTNKYLQLATGEVERLSNLVSQLRQTYRPDAQPEFIPVELSELLTETHLIIEPHLKRSNVEWDCQNIPCGLTVLGYKDQLKQVLMNLALNGIDAMKPAGGLLTTRLFITHGLEQVCISLSDTGRGMPPDLLANIFEPFFTTKETGMGLGLAISYDIVQKHNGRITVESRLNEGTCFKVWLPLNIKGKESKT